MITKEKIKKEIDNIKDEYLEILYRIIKVFEMPVEENAEHPETVNKQFQLHNFIHGTYGCVTNTLIKRGEQGKYEIREAIG